VLLIPVMMSIKKHQASHGVAASAKIRDGKEGTLEVGGGGGEQGKSLGVELQPMTNSSQHSMLRYYRRRSQRQYLG
jgi:hypothetical protein